MAEFAVVAVARNGYEVGDPVSALEDGADFGSAVILPGWWIVKVPSVDLALAQSLINELWEVAQPGDSAFEADDDADRRNKRHRRDKRMVFDLLPLPKRNDLTTTGVTTLSYGQAKQAYRHLTYDRPTDTVSEGGEVLP